MLTKKTALSRRVIQLRRNASRDQTGNEICCHKHACDLNGKLLTQRTTFLVIYRGLYENGTIDWMRTELSRIHRSMTIK